MIEILFCNHSRKVEAMGAGDFHYHNFWQLDWVTEGTPEITIENSVEEIHGGQLILIKPFVNHKYNYSNLTWGSTVKFKMDFDCVLSKNYLVMNLDKKHVSVLNTALNEFYTNSIFKERISQNYLEIF